MPTTKSLQVETAQGFTGPVTPSCIGISENLDPEALLGLSLDSGFNHICQKSGHFFEQELNSTNCIIDSAQNYFKFPIATILTPDDLSDSSERALLAVERSFNSSAQKQEVLASISNAMQAKALPQTIHDDAIAAADEMFTNAVFNAPFVDAHTHKNPGVSRHSSEIKLDGGKFARMFLAHDESRLVIGCEDPFGTLDIERFLQKIRSTYQRGPAATINFGPGGAGIGSYIIFNAGSSLYFGVWPEHASVLCCVIPLGLSNRKRVQLAKHLHWIK
jgi:hypothetical protein